MIQNTIILCVCLYFLFFLLSLSLVSFIIGSTNKIPIIWTLVKHHKKKGKKHRQTTEYISSAGEKMSLQ